MKKTYIAVSILAVLLIITAWHLRHLENFIQEVQDGVVASQQTEDRTEAIALLKKSLNRWDAEMLYTNIFLRQNDIDAINSAYFDLMQQLYSPDGEAEAGYQQLLHELRRVHMIESVNFCSIL